MKGSSLFAGFQCGRRAVGVSPRSQQRTEVELRLAESGSATLLLGGREQLLPPQRLAVFWLGTPHQVLAHEATESWSLRIPLGWLLTRPLPPAFLNGLLEGRIFFEPDIDHFQHDLHRFQLWSVESPAASPLLARAVELELEARLDRLAAGLPAAASPTSPSGAQMESRRSKVLELAALIARNHARSISMTALGRDAGVHRNYAMTLFRRELGTTLLEYLIQHRLAHALRLMITTHLTLTGIARESGFGSLKRLQVTFQQAFKESPRTFRRKHRLT
jgi:AraC-like DNA-binding protein